MKLSHRVSGSRRRLSATETVHAGVHDVSRSHNLVGAVVVIFPDRYCIGTNVCHTKQLGLSTNGAMYAKS
jgi:hypothetical protein